MWHAINPQDCCYCTVYRSRPESVYSLGLALNDEGSRCTDCPVTKEYVVVDPVWTVWYCFLSLYSTWTFLHSTLKRRAHVARDFKKKAHKSCSIISLQKAALQTSLFVRQLSVRNAMTEIWSGLYSQTWQSYCRATDSTVNSNENSYFNKYENDLYLQYKNCNITITHKKGTLKTASVMVHHIHFPGPADI